MLSRINFIKYASFLSKFQVRHFARDSKVRDNLYANRKLKARTTPRSINEMKQIQDFMKTYKETPGKSLNE